MKRISFALSATYASIISIITAVFITIAGELSPAFKNSLKSMSGHHWRTKSYIVVAVFIVSTMILFVAMRNRNISETTLRRSLITTTILALLGALILTGFYVIHFLGE